MYYHITDKYGNDEIKQMLNIDFDVKSPINILLEEG